MQNRHNLHLRTHLRTVAVVPVLTLGTVEEGVGVARALAAGGLRTIEVTLRTPVAFDIIRAIGAALPEVVVGVGTVLSPEQGERAIGAGARFIVSPGMTPRLLEAAAAWPVPFLPGAATASEAMALADLGYSLLKFFPAGPSGGPQFLKALAAPLPGISFCPTGGIDAAAAPAYLALGNVAAVGGSWVAPPAAVAASNWSEITRLATEAAALRPTR